MAAAGATEGSGPALLSRRPLGVGAAPAGCPPVLPVPSEQAVCGPGFTNWEGLGRGRGSDVCVPVILLYFPG